MIHTIIDGNGFLVYSGNIINEKFIRLKDNPDYSVVESTPTNVGNVDALPERAKWEGSQWVVVAPTDMERWVKDMKRSDGLLMNRTQEDIITKIGTDGFAAETKQKYDDKVALRATKPS